MTLRETFEHKILLLDGGMGSLIQEYGIKGANNDMLSIERPEVILDIHRRYVKAGVDVLTANTFSSQRISQHEYHQEDKIAEMNRASVRLARQAAEEATDRKVYVVGDVGPTSKMLSMSDDVNDPAARAITFDELEAAYYEQIKVLVEEGVDGLLIETIFDTLNAKAALSAFDRVRSEELGVRSSGTSHPVVFPEALLSMTVSDASGRTLSGQTVEAFVTSVLHARPLCLGLNCGLGADGMVPYLRQMSAVAPCFVSCHPNAGLPNQFGGYDDTPEDMVRQMQPYFDEKLVNMVGGCCGTTPEHIAAMRAELDRRATEPKREPTKKDGHMHLAGLEPLVAANNSSAFCEAKALTPHSSLFVKVGERCNVAGSRKFLRLINEKNYDEALDIARKQVEDGAMVIDVNMDDGLLDAKQEMVTFLNLLASDPAISRVPIMVDSSRWDVIEAGLKCMQGKGVVNSISLKMGEEEFLEHARTIRRLGAAVIAMCFDEEGQATDYARRVKICQRMYDLLTKEAGFAPEDIIFDPNVLTIATGMSEHFAYAQDFIRATRWVKDHLPGTRVSGGLSNLSFAFRGNNYLREAMHSVFLHHAIPNGMGMAILNPATEVDYKSIPLELRMAITEVVLNTYDEASEELIEIAQRMSEAQAAAKEAGVKYDPKAIFRSEKSDVKGEELSASSSQNSIDNSSLSPELRLQQALLKGVSSTLEADLMELIHRGDSPLNIISGPLMDGMNEVGRLFGEGKMFLPQVVKTARTMKKAVEILNPFMTVKDEEAGAGNAAGRIVIATVKGDVHDIGKNIVGVIMSCNNFQVVDLGVMVPTETIVQAAIEQKADIVSLSGLITPSLEEMCNVATAMQEAGLRIPIMVGGATTSPIHTAVKIAPCYDGPVFHVRDAAMNPGLAMKLLDPAQCDVVIEENRQEQERIRQQQIEKQSQLKAEKTQQEAAGVASPLQRRWTCDWSQYQPAQAPFLGKQLLPTIALKDVAPLIDWTYFYWTWRVKADSEEGQKLKADADTLLNELLNDSAYGLSATQAFYPACGKEDRIIIQLKHSDHDPACPCCNKTLEILTPRQQKAEGTCLALCDYIAPTDASQHPVDSIGAFAVTINQVLLSRLEALKNERGGSDYDVLMLQTLADRLAEAGAEYLSQQLAEQHQWRGIRPAIGYPSLPDQKNIFLLAEMIDFDKVGIRLTENGAMYPQASVCGLYISNPAAEYFEVK